MPRVVFPRTCSVLFIDFMKDRHYKFFCRGPRMLQTRYIQDWDDACKLLKERWEVIFVPGHVPAQRDKNHLVKLICDNPHKPLLVVHHGLDIWTVVQHAEMLEAANVRFAYVPWNYDNPAVHRLVNMDNIRRLASKESD